MFMRLRKFVRNKTGPIPVDVARTWKFNLSFVYAVLAWNILGLAGYYIINFNAPRNNGDIDYIKLLGVKDATVIKYSGFKKVEEYEVHYTDEEMKSFQNEKLKRDSTE